MEITCSPYTPQTASHIIGILVILEPDQSVSKVLQNLVELDNCLLRLGALAILRKYRSSMEHGPLEKHDLVALQEQFVTQRLPHGVATPSTVRLLEEYTPGEFIAFDLMTGNLCIYRLYATFPSDFIL